MTAGWTAAPAIYDPRVGNWTLDTSSLWNLDVGHLAGALVLNMRGHVFLVPRVQSEWPSNCVYATAAFQWFTSQDIQLPAEQHLYEQLRLRWGSAPDKDRGEAAAITLAASRGYLLICDDGTGFRAATRDGAICTMRTTAFVVAMVRCGWISADDGWTSIAEMQNAGRKLGPIPWADRAGYDALCGIPGFDACGQPEVASRTA
jgi:predicted nucleic acid-binding protein